MATAGLRMLEKGVQDRILEACRTVMRGSGFKFYDDWASVISCSDEGVYAWVVANYALGTLGGDPKQTTGIIELGGASAQMLRKLSKQLNGEDWMWNNLNTLLGNRIYIRINDGGTSENKFLVMVIRDLLNLCEITKGKDNKVVIASNIMQMIVNSSFPWLMVISRSLKENGLSNLVKGKFWCNIFCISFLVMCVSEDD
ncbi:unnamed protein product [Coffea canephora]|uniref:DH200=94 genomic scaffold, scaffold_6385 n=1 Tax=Coffea canephora TaxID=49390 RepID=A0A068VM36_COFCA|nr:unnamed protein product [Coffea canephora]